MNLLLLAIALNQIPTQLSTHTRFKNTVVIRGEENQEEISRQVEFYAQYFGLEGLNILVCFTYDLPDHVEGYTCYEENEFSRTVLIKIDKKLTSCAKELTLAHEMIHAKQFATRELIRHNTAYFIWKEAEYANIQETYYQDRPWEKEAFGLERHLLKLYKNYKASLG